MGVNYLWDSGTVIHVNSPFDQMFGSAAAALNGASADCPQFGPRIVPNPQCVPRDQRLVAEPSAGSGRSRCELGQLALHFTADAITLSSRQCLAPA